MAPVLRVALLWAVGLSVPAEAVETMRIAMGRQSRAVVLLAKGLAFGADAEDTAFKPLGAGRATVRLERGRLTLDGVALVERSVRFRAGAWALDAGVPGEEPIRVGEHTVRGDVVVQVERGALQLVNVIALEDYLVGVLGSEMPKTFPPEALKAQAVAARTYALHRKLEALGQPYHLGSGVLSQVYGGLAAEDPRTRAAVEATRGQVLTYELEPVEAYFHASCGGRTESGFSALARDLPYLRPVDCPCGKLAVSKWALTLPAEELRAALGKDEPPSKLEVVARSPTGRARRIAVGPDRVVDAVAFRERVGYAKVKSLAFDVDESEGRYTLTGRGFGHGAGLCQWGAKALAEAGWDYGRILRHYYVATELQVLY
ncbi:MAG: SpoIID/LytB domain-containing protein [Myxococcota bacterium]